MIKNNRIKGLLVVIVAVLFFSCSTEEQEVPEDLVFHSLVAVKDTIAPGGTTSVKATASGSQLEYFWSASLGDILGTGAEVIYAASPCQAGTNKITCKITNGSIQSETKTIEIVVYE
jgi:hypothetical protein